MDRNSLRLRRKKRIRVKISGTGQCPRLAVFRSNKNIYAQVVNDENGTILVAVDLKKIKEKNTVIGAKAAGKKIGELCLKINIKKVVFDRGGYKYHGKVKALAEGAREAGLKF